MRARLGGLAAAALACSFAGALAQAAENSSEPQSQDGWTHDAGGYAHLMSQTKCATESDAFKPVLFSGAVVVGNIVGTCHYEDAMGTGDAGLQVRRYQAGVGESNEAAGNDRMLMEPDPIQGAPLFTVRIVPLTLSDGTKRGRMIITKVRGGFLIDCYGEDADFANASAKVAAVCGK